MADQANDLEAQSNPRRAWVKAIIVCAVMGGAYGAAIGAIIATTDGAAKLIGISAGIMAAICVLPGSRYGFFFGHVNRLRFGRLFVGTVAAVFGAILGGFLGIVAMAMPATLIGAVVGWFLARSISQRDYGFRNGLLGVFLGVCIGAVIATLQKDQAAALVGIAWGLGIGAVSGPVLFFMVIGTLLSLPHTQGGDRGNWFDEAFRR